MLVISEFNVAKGQCPALTKRVYANNVSANTTLLLSSIDNSGLAIDADPKTAATLNCVVGVLGALGNASLDFSWSSSPTIKAGTAVKIKLGMGNGLLGVLPNLTVVGLKKGFLGATVEISNKSTVSPTLLNLLPGDNTVEYTYTPEEDSFAIRVNLGAVVGLAQTAKVFDVYTLQPTTTLDCTKGDVLDIIYGVKDIGIGALSVTVGVENPWNSVDGNPDTYAVMHTGAGILAQAREKIIFSSPSLPTDSVKIITSTGTSLLNINLLTGFSIQRYLGDTPVGVPLDASSNLLIVKLFANNTRAAIILAPTPSSYDRIEILYGGVAGVLSTVNIHEVQRVTSTKLPSAIDIDNNIAVCKGAIISLPTPLDACTTFEWYDAPVNGNLIPGTSINTSSYSAGIKKFYIQPIRNSCKLLTRGIATVTINEPAINIISPQSLCQDVLSTTFPFTISNCNPTQYNIIWSQEALNAGFTNVDFINLPGTLPLSIPITVPGRATANYGNYQGMITVKNASTTGSSIPINVIIKQTPEKPTVTLK
ncbi:hypothetical protein ABDJ41_17555 [Pedobacter sp. ASV1-7]